MVNDWNAYDEIRKVLKTYIKYSKLKIRLQSQDEMSAINKINNNNKTEKKWSSKKLNEKKKKVCDPFFRVILHKHLIQDWRS